MLNTIFNGNVTLAGMGVMLMVAVALGILNALVFSFKNVQTKSFSLTLALLPLISSVIIFMVNDHLGAGVAVAGAFTLVRFRSIKGNGREIVAIFASMAMGLILGMGYVALAVVVFVIVAVLTILLTTVGFGERSTARTLRITIPEDLDYEGIFDDLFARYTSVHELEQVRTKNMGTLYELTYNVTLKDLKQSKQFLDEIRVRNGNLNVLLSTYNVQHEIM